MVFSPVKETPNPKTKKDVPENFIRKNISFTKMKKAAVMKAAKLGKGPKYKCEIEGCTFSCAGR